MGERRNVGNGCARFTSKCFQSASTATILKVPSTFAGNSPIDLRLEAEEESGEAVV